MPIRRNIRLMYSMSFIQGLVFYVSIATLYRRACGLTVFQITLIESISLALTIILELPWGLVSERIGYKKVLVICSFLFFLSKYIFYIADSFGLFLLERIVLAFVMAGLSGVDTSILYISCGEQNAHKAFGTYAALGSAGLLTASAIFTQLPEGSYRLSALLTLIAYGFAAVISLFITEVKPVPERPATPFAMLKTILTDLRRIKGLIPLLLMNVLLFETLHNITVFFSQLQYQRAGAAMRLMGVATIIGAICELSGGLSHRLTRTLGERRFGLCVIFACAAGCFAMAFSANIILSIAAISFLFAARALMGPLAEVIENRMIVSDDRAAALSMNSMLTGCLSIPLNLLLGRSADICLPGTFVICGILILCAGAVFIKALQK